MPGSSDSSSGPQAASVTDVEVAVSSDPEKQAPSLYDVRTSRQRFTILAVVAFSAILLPFSDTIYLPALHPLVEDLHTTDTLGAASVALYMFAVGLTALVWGPFSDRFGRRMTFWLCASGFLATTIVCIFAPTIEVLVAFRALQGCAVTGYMVAGNAVAADIFPPEQRGRAAGIFMIPVLVGPVLGPLIGGGLCQAFGWRSAFVALAIAAVIASVGILIVLREETHQYHTLQRIRAQHGDDYANSLKEAAHVSAPVFHPPWQPLRMLLERAVAPYAAMALLLFAPMFATLVVTPMLLSLPPYSLPAGIIGVAFLPSGVGSFVASPIGGKMADAAASRYPNTPAARLLPGTVVCAVLMPLSLLVFGWTFHFRTNLAGPLIAHFFVCAAVSIYLPAIFSYLGIIKQRQAAAANALVQGLMFITAGVFILASVPIVNAIGAGPLFSILAGAVALVGTIACFAIIASMRSTAAGNAAGLAPSS